jgi:demethylmenaquinone methyltransferase/2-methoxy-6-polyprenyl-1,4-benzoquinol methylase
MDEEISKSDIRKSEIDEADEYARRLAVLDPLRAPAFRAAIEALRLPEGSQGLDVGCGIGLQALLLARAVGPAGHVTGLDRNPAFLERARAAAERAGLAGRCSFRQGDLRALPDDDGTFDWLWCADTLWVGPRELGCPVQDALPVVREFARVVRPGGTVALVYWSAQKLLPGYPLLEARLAATSVPTAPFREGMPPQAHVLRALGWLRAAGLGECTARTYVSEVQAPLADAVHPRGELRDALAAAMEMFWGQVEAEVSAEDWAQFQRLCRPDSAECILDAPGYYGFLTYTLFSGRVGG